MRKLLALLLFVLVFPVIAQDFTIHQEIRLIPFIIDSFDIQGLRPQSWQTQANLGGVFLRRRDSVDLTALIIQARQESEAVFLEELQSQFALTELPTLRETLETEALSWGLYQFERQQSGQNLTVNLALATNSESTRVYYVLMQTTAIFHEELYAEVFLAVTQSISPIQRYEDPEGRFDVPIPLGWELDEMESYAVLHDTDKTIFIYVGAVDGTDAPAALQTFWEQIYPDFALQFDPVNGVRLIEDPARIGGLEQVYIVDWQKGTDEQGHIKQGVARVYAGTIYMTLIETDINAVVQADSAIEMVDNYYRVLALLPEATPEATEAP